MEHSRILGRIAPTARSLCTRRSYRNVAAVAALTLLFGTVRAAAQETGPTEYQVKAAFLFNFAKFIEWPPSSFASPEAPFSICILGVDPFGPVIDETLRGQTLGGRAVTIERVRAAAQLRQCQVAFISASEKVHLQVIFQAIRGASVLLVGESPGFAAAGGTIQFQVQDNHIRFAINPVAAQRAGLRVSSKLLSLVTIVRNAGDKGTGGSS
jgi:hypothetical protein